MKTPAKDPSRRFQILSLLDGTHKPPRNIGRWTTAAVSEYGSISYFNAHHLLVRLKSYALVSCGETGEEVETHRTLKSGQIMIGKIPRKTLVWEITEKGLGRVEYAGGHKKWCPIC